VRWSWLLILLLGLPVAALPSLDDYALPTPTTLPSSGRISFTVQSNQPIPLRANQRVSIPVQDAQNGNSATLNGQFIPEGEVAGRLVFDQVVTDRGTYPLTAQTDLLPAHPTAQVPPSGNNVTNAPPSYNPPLVTSQLFRMALRFLGLGQMPRSFMSRLSPPVSTNNSYGNSSYSNGQPYGTASLEGELQPGQPLEITLGSQP